ncbi:MAG: EamA family transporter [Rhodobacter sp.]|nr:EamA family transporter [Rhodobacter sp.]
MTRATDIVLTAIAPAVWGTTYIVTTEALPPDLPLTLAALRALPAGLILLALTRSLPGKDWIGRTFLLGALNFSIFWTLLFVAAYRLPGGVAATLGAMQPLMVIGLAFGLLGTPIRSAAVGAALTGLAGVGLLVLGPEAQLDGIGVLAGIGGAASMAAGVVLSRKWQPDVPPLAFAGWQLTAGGLILLPVALIAEPSLPPLTLPNLAGLIWLGPFGAAFTYWLWFRGIARLEPGSVSMLGTLSPVTAVVIGWLWLGETLSTLQALGAIIVLASVMAGQRIQRPAQAARPVSDARPSVERPGATGTVSMPSQKPVNSAAT